MVQALQILYGLVTPYLWRCRCNQGMIGRLRQTGFALLSNKFSIANAKAIAMKRTESLMHFRIRLRVAVASGALLAAADVCSAQTQVQPQPSPAANVAVLYGSESRDGRSATSVPAVAAHPDLGISPALANKLAEMQAEIEALKAELKTRSMNESAPSVDSVLPASTAIREAKAVEPASAKASDDAAQASSGLPEKPRPAEPFAFADWTWLNGTPRTKDVVWDSKFFTPEIRFDANYIMDLNHPRDSSIGGSTEIFRSNEVQIEQISFGGNFHWQNVNARILTMGGMFGVTTPRNDASPGRGQWDLRGAYKYFSEANA